VTAILVSYLIAVHENIDQHIAKFLNVLYVILMAKCDRLFIFTSSIAHSTKY